MNTKHRHLTAWAFLIAYVLGFILLHRKGNELAGSMLIAYGPARYTLGVRILSIIGAAAACVLLFHSLRTDRTRWKQLVLLLPFALAIDMTMIIVPIERIHYLQYGLLTWICYVALEKPFLSAMLAFAIGVFDEAHQYVVLYAGDPVIYFDWNDILLNLLGVYAALLLFLPKPSAHSVRKQRLVTAIAGWIFAVSLFVSFVKPDRYLFRDDPYHGSTSFWITSGSRPYHVMDALQGLSILGTILIVSAGYYLPGRPNKQPEEVPAIENKAAKAASSS